MDDTKNSPACHSDNRPLRAKVYEKKLSAVEQAIILAVLEIGDSTGRKLYISVPRIAAWAKLDEKTVQRGLWGDHRKHPGQPKPKREKGQPDKECPFCPDSLISRRVLHQLAPANWKKHWPAQYELILDLLEDSDDVRHYLDQKKLNFTPNEKRPTVARFKFFIQNPRFKRERIREPAPTPSLSRSRAGKENPR